VTVLPVVVVLLLVWLGVWSQCRVTVDVTEPVLSMAQALQPLRLLQLAFLLHPR